MTLDSSWRSERFAKNVASELVNAYLECPEDEDQADNRTERLYDLLDYFFYSTIEIVRGEYSREDAQTVYDTLDEARDRLRAHKNKQYPYGLLSALMGIIDRSSDASRKDREDWENCFRDLALRLDIYHHA